MLSSPGAVETNVFVTFDDGETRRVYTTARRRPKERLRAYIKKKWPDRKFVMGNLFERHFWGAH